MRDVSSTEGGSWWLVMSVADVLSVLVLCRRVANLNFFAHIPSHLPARSCPLLPARSCLAHLGRLHLTLGFLVVQTKLILKWKFVSPMTSIWYMYISRRLFLLVAFLIVIYRYQNAGYMNMYIGGIYIEFKCRHPDMLGPSMLMILIKSIKCLSFYPGTSKT